MCIQCFQLIDNAHKMVTVYVLELSDNKYYVGKTNNLDARIKEHITNNGSAWTTKYKPLTLVEKYENCDDFDEDKYVKIYMMRCGIDNVRGGSYSQIVLEPNVIEMLNKELCSATDKCFTCGLSSHFTKECRGKEIEEMYHELNNTEDMDMDMDIEWTYYQYIYEVEKYVTYFVTLHKLPPYYMKHQKDSLNNIIAKTIECNIKLSASVNNTNHNLDTIIYNTKMVKCLQKILNIFELTETGDALYDKYEQIFKYMFCGKFNPPGSSHRFDKGSIINNRLNNQINHMTLI